MFLRVLLPAAISVLLFIQTSCVKDQPVTSKSGAAITLVFDASMKGETLQYDTKWYTNFSGDSFTVQKFNYYISNIRFIRKDGSAFIVPESYHLIEHASGKQRIQLRELPETEFKSIEFIVGVDSLRNTSGSQSGDLDPSNNMFWDWNTGYIFFKLEGRFNTLTQTTRSDYAIHVGGFIEPNNCIQYYKADLPENLITKNNKTTFVYFRTRVEEIFENPRFIDFDYYYANLGNSIFKQVSQNYADMFLPYKIVNP